MISQSTTLLGLLQLTSPALPVGAYSYSEGLEFLVEEKKIDNKKNLCNWIERELRYGTIRVETAVMLRAYQNWEGCDREARIGRDRLNYWNAWLSASRETTELRQQSWQMGQSLLKLLRKLQPEWDPLTDLSPCNYAIAFAIAAARWQIKEEDAIAAYLYSWSANLVGAGVKLIPLGQTEGQQILFELRDRLVEVAGEIRAIADDELESCSWGLTAASMRHETQYTRLFRS
ncbi:MAG: urease accessory protein UreF [Cyanobacteriota bacterium]|nr:urease accessory protein UreF [Cyanobacteriota bacterium]